MRDKIISDELRERLVKKKINPAPEETKVSVAGFEDVAKHVFLIGMDDGYKIPVAPIEGIFILKLVAWNVNPENR